MRSDISLDVPFVGRDTDSGNCAQIICQELLQAEDAATKSSA